MTAHFINITERKCLALKKTATICSQPLMLFKKVTRLQLYFITAVWIHIYFNVASDFEVAVIFYWPVNVDWRW
jgi:hypothetical protein